MTPEATAILKVHDEELAEGIAARPQLVAATEQSAAVADLGSAQLDGRRTAGLMWR